MSFQSSKKSLIIILVVLVVVITAIGYFLYVGMTGNKTSPSILSPFGAPKEQMPPIPLLKINNTIFDKIDKINLGFFVDLPVESGNKGKENPFEPFDGFRNGTNGVEAPQPQPTPEGTPTPEMGQNSK